MFFILSKLLTVFIDPTAWLILVVILAAFLKKGKWKKRATIFAIVLFIFFTNDVIYSLVINAWQPSPVTLTKKYSTGILLGGFTVFDAKGKGYLSATSDRFVATSTLYHLGIINKIIVSGGDGSINQENPKEADFAKYMFEQNGVKEADVFAESRSRNTFENAMFSKRMLDSLHLQPPYVLVTSASHMPRAAGVFKKAGLDIDIYPCAYQTVKSRFSFGDYVVPSIDNLVQWRIFIREFVGYWIYKITGKL
ncbi:YdcF family protein [Pinibacter aurantiacus]|uniref:YdcF family protein n=1 Tax=Pinibacter aurantiacus TaxID=2851599 RepID=A0A9E2W6B0_9BACT|nr:YdcF family protein [Pinibacter aurantiacus]MBV4359628.1 YdcF family protein [Pinibacter aurantiacus]